MSEISEKSAPLPKIALQDAMKLAMEYLNSNRIRNEHRRLGAAKWDIDPVTEQWSWSLSWMTADELHEIHHVIGSQAKAQLIVNVFDDGQVNHTLTS